MARLSGDVHVPGGQLRYDSDGDGPPVVLVHAGIVDRSAWDGVVPHLVDAGYRAIRYDSRGWGESPTEDVEFSNRSDLVAVLDTLAINRAALVGNSRGGAIVVDTTVEFPDRVVALISIAGGISGFEAEPTAEEQALIDAMEAAEDANDADRVAEIDIRLWVDGVGQPPGRVPSAIREAVRAMDRPLYEPGRVFGRPQPLDPPANERLGEITVPTLAIVGALDTSGTKAAVDRLAAAIRGARRVILPDVAHLPGLEVPDRVAELIVGHLRPIGDWN